MPQSTAKNLNKRLDVDFAIKAAQLGVWELDPATNLVIWDDRCRELFGVIERNTLPYEEALNYIHPEDASRVDKAVKTAMKAESGGSYDETYRTTGVEDGKLRWARFIGQSYFDESGKAYRFAGIAQELTLEMEARQREQALTEGRERERQQKEKLLAAVVASENRFQHLIRQAPVAIALFDGPEFVIELANERVLEFWGRTREQVMHKPLFEALPEASGQGFEELLTEVFNTGNPFYSPEMPVQLFRNGQMEQTYIDFVYEPYYDAEEKITGIMVVANEITQQVMSRQHIEASESRYRQLSEDLDERVQQRTQELDEMNRDLIRSNQNLEKFAYIASHDLQEPLRKIQAFGDLLKSQHADNLGKGLDYLQRMQSSASRMSILITDLLTYSRISTRQQAASTVPLSLTLSQVLENLSLTVAETKAQVTLSELPVIQGDPTQLGQLFQNLLSNALKFRQKTEEGKLLNPVVTIRSEEVLARDLPSGTKPSRQAHQYHRIDVTDEGIGFDDKYTDRIFQVFQRLHGKSDYPGTGVGLAICEKVALNHGGAISVVSQPGQGSTFSVFLPKT
ncbi:ATP-binding protein [Persicitalea sp.]|uniref:sensor histidine kinase n=1 Tax=Persicitalea sp. TaxID=3100273 RepID=UPI00359453E3